LTQNTAWKNVEKAIMNLTKLGRLELNMIASARGKWLEEAVRPSGYFRQKAERLKRTAIAIKKSGGIKELSKIDTLELRKLLLSWHGFGFETADSVLCYAFSRPIFVVDAYTKRLFDERKLPFKNYDDIQNAVHSALPASAGLYGDFHARIVKYFVSRREAVK